MFVFSVLFIYTFNRGAQMKFTIFTQFFVWICGFFVFFSFFDVSECLSTCVCGSGLLGLFVFSLSMYVLIVYLLEFTLFRCFYCNFCCVCVLKTGAHRWVFNISTIISVYCQCLRENLIVIEICLAGKTPFYLLLIWGQDVTQNAQSPIHNMFHAQLPVS